MHALLILVSYLLLSVQAWNISDYNIANKDYVINPKAFVVIGDRNYYMVPSEIKRDPISAMALCNDFGMSMISLETEEEIALVRDYILANGDSETTYWTSGREIEARFQWTGSGQMMTATNWDVSEPSWVHPGNCVYMKFGDKWADDSCAIERNFICEQQP